MTKSVIIGKRHRIASIRNAHVPYLREKYGHKSHIFSCYIIGNNIMFSIFKKKPDSAAQERVKALQEVHTMRARSSCNAYETSTMW